VIWIALALFHGLLLALLASVSTAESAMRAVRDWDGDLQEGLRAEGLPQLRHLAANPFGMLHRMLLLSALLNLLLALVTLIEAYGPLKRAGFPPLSSAAIGIAAGLFLAVVLPKFLARRASMTLLARSLGWLRLMGPLLDPLLAWTDRLSDSLLRRMLPQRLKSRLPMTRDEFETLVDMRQQGGASDAVVLGVIAEALELERLMARDCMVPRVDLALVGVEDSDQRAQRILEQSAGRFAVVYDQTPDAVLGVVDVPAWRLAGQPRWQELLQTVAFVPETMPVAEVMEQHLLRSPMPVVLVDEYGGFEGLLSLHELADWLLSGTAPWGREGGEVRELAPGRYLVDGGARVEEVAQWLQVSLPSRGVDSIGGWVFTELGHVPKAGERLHLHGVDFKVRRVVKARILELELRKKAVIMQPTAGEALSP
jgi:putative hemolysin